MHTPDRGTDPAFRYVIKWRIRFFPRRLINPITECTHESSPISRSYTFWANSFPDIGIFEHLESVSAGNAVDERQINIIDIKIINLFFE